MLKRLSGSLKKRERPYYGEWWHVSGSPSRFEPRNRAESLGYTEGLRDAIRISREIERYSGVEGRVASPAMRRAMIQMHGPRQAVRGRGPVIGHDKHRRAGFAAHRMGEKPDPRYGQKVALYSAAYAKIVQDAYDAGREEAARLTPQPKGALL